MSRQAARERKEISAAGSELSTVGFILYSTLYGIILLRHTKKRSISQVTGICIFGIPLTIIEAFSIVGLGCTFLNSAYLTFPHTSQVVYFCVLTHHTRLSARNLAINGHSSYE